MDEGGGIWMKEEEDGWNGFGDGNSSGSDPNFDENQLTCENVSSSAALSQII
jgi:hypothetical protein